MQRTTVSVLSLVTLFVAVACGTKDPQEHTKRGTDYLQQKKYAEAIVELRTALHLDPNLGEVRVKLADAYTATGDSRNGFREIVRAADLLPKTATVQIRAGNILLAAGSFDDANARANRVLENDPN